MAASMHSSLVTLVRFRITVIFAVERSCLMLGKPWNAEYAFRSTIKDRSLILGGRKSHRHCTSCLLETLATTTCTNSKGHGDFGLGVMKVLGMEEEKGTVMNIMSGILQGDIDPATAKVAISIIGPVLSGFSFLFIIRIVMSWYPKLPVDKFPYVVAYAPTEPILVATRKVIPPLGGVDVTPVVWFGLLSFANEILVGPQGLLVLISQQV